MVKDLPSQDVVSLQGDAQEAPSKGGRAEVRV